MELITAKQAVRQLKEEAGVVISQQRFGKLKQEGIFQVHRKPNSRKDWFVFKEVLEAYLANVSPKTEEQHKARSDYYHLQSDEAATIDPDAFSTKDSPSLTQSRSRKEALAVKLLELEYQEKIGTLIKKTEVYDALFMVAREARDALNKVPDRIKAIIAHQTDEHICGEIMATEIREALLRMEEKAKEFGKDAADEGKCKEA